MFTKEQNKELEERKTMTKMMKTTKLIVMMTALIMAFTLCTDNTYAASKKPGKVTGVKVTAVAYDSVGLSWKAAKKAKTYKVYMATSKKGKFKCVKTVKTTSATVGSLKTGSTYYFKVRAFNGKKKGKYCKKVSAKPYLKKPGLAEPVGLDYGIKVTASNIPGASGYIFYRDGKAISKQSNTVFTDTKAKSGVYYTYEVRAYRNISGKTVNSSLSAPKSGMFTEKSQPTQGTDNDNPGSTETISAPSLKVGTVTENSVALSWTCSSSVNGFYVYRNNTKVATVTSNSYTDNGLTASTTYTYKVVAYKGSATASSSNVNATTSAHVDNTPFLEYSANGGETTKITLGDTFTNQLFSKLKSGSSGEDVINRPSYISGKNVSLYLFDVGDYDNYIAIVVCDSDGKILGWETTREVMAQTESVTIRRGDSVSSVKINGYESSYIKQTSVSKNYVTYVPVGGYLFGGICPSGTKSTGSLSSSQEERLAMHTVNAYRVLAGRSILEWNDFMAKDAHAFAETMVADPSSFSSYGHDTSKYTKGPLAGMTMIDRIDNVYFASGETVLSFGENIATGRIGECAVGSYMNSNGHMNAIVHPDAEMFASGFYGGYHCEQYGMYK